MFLINHLTDPKEKDFGNIVGKEENVVLLFPFFSKQISLFESDLFCRLQMLSIWTGLKVCRFADDILFTDKIIGFVFSKIKSHIWEKEIRDCTL